MLSGEMRPVPRSGYARSAKSAPPCDALLLAERLRWFGLSLRASEGLSRLGASRKIGVSGWWSPASRPEIFGTTVCAVHLHTGSVSLVRTSLDRTDVEHRTKLAPSGNHRGAQTALRSYAAIGSRMSLSSSATRVWPACCPIAEDRVRSRKLRAPSHRPARESTGLRARRLQDDVGDRCGGRSTTRAESHASVRAMPAFIRLRVYAHSRVHPASTDAAGAPQLKLPRLLECLLLIQWIFIRTASFVPAVLSACCRAHRRARAPRLCLRGHAHRAFHCL